MGKPLKRLALGKKTFLILFVSSLNVESNILPNGQKNIKLNLALNVVSRCLRKPRIKCVGLAITKKPEGKIRLSGKVVGLLLENILKLRHRSTIERISKVMFLSILKYGKIIMVGNCLMAGLFTISMVLKQTIELKICWLCLEIRIIQESPR